MASVEQDLSRARRLRHQGRDWRPASRWRSFPGAIRRPLQRRCEELGIRHVHQGVGRQGMRRCRGCWRRLGICSPRSAPALAMIGRICRCCSRPGLAVAVADAHPVATRRGAPPHPSARWRRRGARGVRLAAGRASERPHDPAAAVRAVLARDSGRAALSAAADSGAETISAAEVVLGGAWALSPSTRELIETGDDGHAAVSARRRPHRAAHAAGYHLSDRSASSTTRSRTVITGL